MTPYISICIPAYKRVRYLKRLLDSIAIQRYKNFEIIVSDDSDDDSVHNLVQSFSATLAIQYFKNSPSRGTPANWNFAVSRAKGEWIKLMHDDDWFASEDALSGFAAYAAKGEAKFIFSAYANCYETTNVSKPEKFPLFWSNRIVQSPVTLLARNVVGPPSVTLVHKSISEQYDERMKWRVDLDFYIRILFTEKSYVYIDQVLVNVGVNDSQVTNECINIPAVELPEGYLLIEKYGSKTLKNILVYDAWWRLLRNMLIIKKEQLSQYGQTNWPPVIVTMVQHQSRCPRFLLNTGITSKFVMFCSWCINYIKSNF
ncbi:MAG: glycosyl transferase family 2 [Chitinophagaceae bacterium]|nr:glycosyl transferase family 2 [Chitinophagaceae bacterium]